MKKQFLVWLVLGGAVAWMLSRAFAADISPGQPLGRPLQNGDQITAAVLNSALAGTVNSTFYTGKSSKTVPDPANDILLMYDLNDLVFYKTTFGNVYRNVNIISNQTAYTTGVSNSQSVLIYDPLLPGLGQTTISNLIYYSLLLNTNQLSWGTNGNTLTIISNYATTNGNYYSPTLTNGAFNNGTLNGTMLTNSYTSNTFTVYAPHTKPSLPGFRIFDPDSPAVNRAWSIIPQNASNLVFGVASDDFTAFNTIMEFDRNGSTPLAVQFPYGVKVGGSSGTAIGQMNTFISGTNNAFALGSLLTIPHSMGVTPTDFHGRFVVINATNNWNAGDEIRFEDTSGNANVPIASLYADNNNVYVRMTSAAMFIMDKNTGNQVGPIITNIFKVRVYATYIR